MIPSAASETSAHRPLVLTVPGLGNSGPAHWQTLWEQTRDDSVRVDLGMWDNPRRNAWVSKLDRAIATAEAPVILAAHSLGCLAVAWWAELAGQPWGWPVAGALLVAPPDVERADACEPIRGFGPVPRSALPFPSILVGSEDDSYCTAQRAFDMAREWGSHFVDAGPAGHLNAESRLGFWRDGQRLLDRLIGAAEDTSTQTGPTLETQAMLANEARG